MAIAFLKNYRCRACELRFRIGIAGRDDFRSGYYSRSFFVCSACGGQHCIDNAFCGDQAEFFDDYEVELLQVPEADRKAAVQLLRVPLNHNTRVAKEILERLPHREAVHLDHDREEIDRIVAGTGIVLKYHVTRRPNEEYGRPKMLDRLSVVGVVRKPVDRADSVADWIEPMEVALSAPRGDRETIDLTQQKCGLCPSVGTITRDIEVSTPCPACRRAELEIVKRLYD